MLAAWLVVLVLAASGGGFTFCPPGTVQSDLDSSVCYKFVKAKRTFLEAEGMCRSDEGHLASITSGLANAFINDHALRTFTNVSDGYFIGANDLARTGKSAWTDGSKFAYTHGGKGEPVQNVGLDCAYVALADGVWHAGNCFTQRPFVCIVPQTNATQCPPPPTCPAPTCPESKAPQACPTSTTSLPTTTTGPVCMPGWERYVSRSGVYCYKYFAAEVMMIDSIATCALWQSTIVSIHDVGEDEFVRRLTLAKIRLGMRWPNNDINQSWQWYDGTRFDYANFGDLRNGTYPGDNACGFMDLVDDSLGAYEYGRTWHASGCAVKAAFVCKKPASKCDGLTVGNVFA